DAVRSRHLDTVYELELDFFDHLHAKDPVFRHTGTAGLAWAIIVESALLNERLRQDIREAAANKGCACQNSDHLPFFLPNPPLEARQAFNEYVRCRWPIHV